MGEVLKTVKFPSAAIQACTVQQSAIATPQRHAYACRWGSLAGPLALSTCRRHGVPARNFRPNKPPALPEKAWQRRPAMRHTHHPPALSRRRDNVSRAVSPTLAGLGEGRLFTLQLLLRYLPPSMTIRFTHGAAAARRGAGQQHGTLTTLVQPLPPIMCALRVKLRGSWS